MNHMTNYLKNKVITDNLQNVYVGLFSDTTEIYGPSYERKSIVFTSPNEGQTSNNADILFPIATESWGNITHIGIFDNNENGNLLFKSPAEVVKHIDTSSQYKIPKNYLIIRLK